MLNCFIVGLTGVANMLIPIDGEKDTILKFLNERLPERKCPVQDGEFSNKCIAEGLPIQCFAALWMSVTTSTGTAQPLNVVVSGLMRGLLSKEVLAFEAYTQEEKQREIAAAKPDYENFQKVYGKYFQAVGYKTK